jgi:ribosomal protein L11 methyltransferase
MTWLRLTIQTGAAQVAPLTELLESFSAIAVSLHPESAEPLFDGPENSTLYWRNTAVSALLPQETDMDILLACLRNRVGTENIHGHRIELLPDQDWIEAHKEGITPLQFAGRLLVTPSWMPPDPGHPCSLVLDPGLAFGTGTHQTTALCLEWLAARDCSGYTVIDYGCGSGILALAAARLGAEQVLAVDIDAQAVKATRENALRNGLETTVIAGLSDELQLPPADLVMANILLNPLLELAPRIGGYVKARGQLLLSGILAVQIEACLAAYARDFAFGDPVYKDEWALLHGIRRDPQSR